MTRLVLLSIIGWQNNLYSFKMVFPPMWPNPAIPLPVCIYRKTKECEIIFLGPAQPECGQRISLQAGSRFYLSKHREPMMITYMYKVCFYNSAALFSPLDRSQRYTRQCKPVHSDTNSTFLESIQSHCKLLHKDHPLTFPPMFISIYTEHWVNWGVVDRIKMHKLRNGSKGDSDLGSLGWESGILPLSNHTHTLHTLYEDERACYLCNLDKTILGLCF